MNDSALETSDSITCSSPVHPAGLASGRLRRVVVPVLILAGAAVAAHGWGVDDGLFFDDHLHVLRYQDGGWSPQALLDSTTIVPEEFMDTWWQERTIQWQYARPFAMFLAKLVYRLSGGSVKALHVLSLALHVAGAGLVYYLCLLLTRRQGWSLVGGLLFVIHSHSVYAVGWLAAQNSVLQTVLTLAALLSYVRASGLSLYAGERPAGEAAAVEAGDRRWFAVALVLWVLALLSREGALVLPVFAVLLDLTFGGWNHLRRRIAWYGLMAVIGLAFAVWRLRVFYVPMPDFYVRRYDGPAYITWWIAKLLHYIVGVIWLSPLMIGPSARFDPFREVPGDCALMIGIVAVLGTGYYLACRRARGWWIWPLWILLSLVPVVPIFAGPHSAYMPAVGYAVAMVLGPALRREIRPVSIGKWSAPVAIWFLIATTTYMPIYRTFWGSVQAAERLTIAQMAAAPPPQAATDVFLINVPFVNIYARLHLREELPDRDFRFHVLTYAPNILRMEGGSRLEQVDARTFRLALSGKPYFSSAMGRYLIESMRPSGRLHTGTVVQRPEFEVQVLRADEEGVQELQFRFREPLASRRYCFYLGTNRQAAVRVQFEGPGDGVAEGAARSVGLAEVRQAAQEVAAGRADAAEVLFAAMNGADADVAREAETVFRPAAEAIAGALASPLGDTLARPQWTADDRAAIRRWWHRVVHDDILRVVWSRRHEWEAYHHCRDRLFAIQQIAGRIIRTDLYMTGPPYPGPR